MTSRSYIQWSPCNNLPADFTREQNELAGPQSPAKRSDAGNNKALTPSEAFILSLVPPTKDFFTKFMKAFVKSIQAWD